MLIMMEKKVYQKYLENKPKTSSEKLEFVKNNAPRVVAGLDTIGRFFEDLKRNNIHELQIKQDSLITTS